MFFLLDFNRFPELSRTTSPFPGLSSPGKCHNKIPGLSRFSRTRASPVFNVDYKTISNFLSVRSATSGYPGFCSMKRLRDGISTPPGRNAGPSQVTPPQFVRFPPQFTSIHLYSRVERGTVRVKCLVQKHNTVSPARAGTRTARSGDEHTNHEANAPP